MRCPSCQRYFCKECATEHEGRLLCAGCLAKLTAAASVTSTGQQPLRKFAKVAGWVMAALSGLLFTWLVFYYLGAGLARAPFDFHTG